MKAPDTVPPMKADADAATAPSTSPAPAPAPQAAAPAPATQALVLTDEEAKGWVGKPVYGADDKKIGDIAEVKRDSENKVTEIDFDAGGFLGFGATRYRATADQIQETKSDRLVLKITSNETANLPPVASK